MDNESHQRDRVGWTWFYGWIYNSWNYVCKWNANGILMNKKQKKLMDKHRNNLLYVEVKNNNVEKALSIFKKRVKNSGLLKEIRDREFYEKPSAEKRRKRNMVKHRKKYSIQ